MYTVRTSIHSKVVARKKGADPPIELGLGGHACDQVGPGTHCMGLDGQ